MSRHPLRNATRKPVTYPRDAHVMSWIRFADRALGCDPEDMPPPDRETINAWALWCRKGNSWDQKEGVA